MNKVYLITVVNHDMKEKVAGVFADKDKADKAAGAMLYKKIQLLNQKIEDVVDTMDGEEFDDQYEDFLFNKMLAEQVLTIKVQEFPVQ